MVDIQEKNLVIVHDRYNRIQAGFLKVGPKTFPVFKGVNTIGRNKDAVINIKNLNVSTQHATITIIDDSQHYLSDLKSSNGTMLTTTKLTPFKLYEICNGTEIYFGGIPAYYTKVIQNESTVISLDQNTMEMSQNMTQNMTQTFYACNTQMISDDTQMESSPDEHNYSNVSPDGVFLRPNSSTVVPRNRRSIQEADEEDIHNAETQIDTNSSTASKVKEMFDIQDAATQLINEENDKEEDDYDGDTQVDDIYNAETQADTSNARALKVKEILDASKKEAEAETDISLHNAETQVESSNERALKVKKILDASNKEPETFDEALAQFESNDDNNILSEAADSFDTNNEEAEAVNNEGPQADLTNEKDAEVPEIQAPAQFLDKANQETENIHDAETQLSTDTQMGDKIKDILDLQCAETQLLDSMNPDLNPPHDDDDSFYQPSHLKDFDTEDTIQRLGNSNRRSTMGLEIEESIINDSRQEKNNDENNSTDSVDFLTMAYEGEVNLNQQENDPNSESLIKSPLRLSQLKKRVKNRIDSDLSDESQIQTGLLKNRRKNRLDSDSDTESTKIDDSDTDIERPKSENKIEEVEEKTNECSDIEMDDSDDETMKNKNKEKNKLKKDRVIVNHDSETDIDDSDNESRKKKITDKINTISQDKIHKNDVDDDLTDDELDLRNKKTITGKNVLISDSKLDSEPENINDVIKDVRESLGANFTLDDDDDFIPATQEICPKLSQNNQSSKNKESSPNKESSQIKESQIGSEESFKLGLTEMMISTQNKRNSENKTDSLEQLSDSPKLTSRISNSPKTRIHNSQEPSTSKSYVSPKRSSNRNSVENTLGLSDFDMDELCLSSSEKPEDEPQKKKFSFKKKDVIVNTNISMFEQDNAKENIDIFDQPTQKLEHEFKQPLSIKESQKNTQIEDDIYIQATQKIEPAHNISSDEIIYELATQKLTQSEDIYDIPTQKVMNESQSKNRNMNNQVFEVPTQKIDDLLAMSNNKENYDIYEIPTQKIINESQNINNSIHNEVFEQPTQKIDEDKVTKSTDKENDNIYEIATQKIMNESQNKNKSINNEVFEVQTQKIDEDKVMDTVNKENDDIYEVATQKIEIEPISNVMEVQSVQTPECNNPIFKTPLKTYKSKNNAGQKQSPLSRNTSNENYATINTDLNRTPDNHEEDEEPYYASTQSLLDDLKTPTKSKEKRKSPEKDLSPGPSSSKKKFKPNSDSEVFAKEVGTDEIENKTLDTTKNMYYDNTQCLIDDLVSATPTVEKNRSLKNAEEATSRSLKRGSLMETPASVKVKKGKLDETASGSKNVVKEVASKTSRKSRSAAKLETKEDENNDSNSKDKKDDEKESDTRKCRSTIKSKTKETDDISTGSKVIEITVVEDIKPEANTRKSRCASKSKTKEDDETISTTSEDMEEFASKSSRSRSKSKVKSSQKDEDKDKTASKEDKPDRRSRRIKESSSDIQKSKEEKVATPEDKKTEEKVSRSKRSGKKSDLSQNSKEDELTIEIEKKDKKYEETTKSSSQNSEDDFETIPKDIKSKTEKSDSQKSSTSSKSEERNLRTNRRTIALGFETIPVEGSSKKQLNVTVAGHNRGRSRRIGALVDMEESILEKLPTKPEEAVIRKNEDESINSTSSMLLDTTTKTTRKTKKNDLYFGELKVTMANRRSMTPVETSEVEKKMEEKTIAKEKQLKTTATKRKSTRGKTINNNNIKAEPSTSSSGTRRTENTVNEVLDLPPPPAKTAPAKRGRKASKTVPEDGDVSDSTESTSSVRSKKESPKSPTRSSSSRNSRTTSVAPESPRGSRPTKQKVVFTMMESSPQLESAISLLGGKLVNSVEDCTTLVTQNIKRSQKLLMAVGDGKPICSPQWIKESKKANIFRDPWDYILIDKEAEKKWNFSLKESLMKSRETKILNNYSFRIILNDNNIQNVLKSAIEACGGKCVKTTPKQINDHHIIISVKENKSKYAGLLKNHPKLLVVEPEAIFDGVLRQELRFKNHLLT